MPYEIKCDECKVKIGETDSVRESAAGGRCEDCRATVAAQILSGQVRSLRLACMTGLRRAPGAAVEVRLSTIRRTRTAVITYDRRSDTYSVKRTTITGSKAASLEVREFEGVYADSLATILEADGFDGRIA